MTMEGMFINGKYIPWPSPYLTRAEYDRAKSGPEEHDQAEAGQEDAGE